MATDEWVVVRLKMQDTAKFIADAKAAGASINYLDRQTAQLGRTFRTSGQRGFWFNQIMFTLRRQVYGVTLGLGALGIAAGVMGFKFDIGMEAAKMAFTRFLGGPEAANKEVEYLFDLAAKTPFEFPQLADAARKFLAFGYSVDETNSTLEALSDAVAAFGKGAPEIDRAVLALGQMRSAGRVLGQDLRQLQELGLFDPADFARRLSLPQGYLAHVGQLGIPSEAGIKAITDYWRERFGGASEEFSKTFMGRITTLRDYAGRAFGAMVQPLKDRLTNEIFPLLIRAFEDAGEAFETGGMTAALESIDKNLGKGTDLAGVWTYLADVGGKLWYIVSNLAQSFWNAWNAAQGNIIVFGTLYILVYALWDIMRILNHEILFGVSALEILLFILILDRLAIIAVTLATRAKVFWDILDTAWTKRKTWAESIYIMWLYRGNAALWARLAAARLVTIAMLFYTVSLGPAIAATWAFAAALWATGIPEIVILVAILAGLLVASVVYWDQWTAAVKRAHAWVDRMLDKLGLLGKALNVWSYLNPVTGPFRAAGWALQHFQFGGTMSFPGGPAIVGEAGPEAVYLPGGSRVQPLSAMQQVEFPGQTNDREIVIKNNIFLDGRQISESVARHRLNQKARA
jgi:hypothetical protein